MVNEIWNLKSTFKAPQVGYIIAQGKARSGVKTEGVTKNSEINYLMN